MRTIHRRASRMDANRGAGRPRPDDRVARSSPLATVAVLSGNPSTLTNPQGQYTLQNVPSGSQQLVATRGNFMVEFTVQVQPNQTVVAAPAKLAPVGKLAFVRGSFDSIEDFVMNSLGNPMDELTAQQLGTPATLAQYRMIFLNCGLDDQPAADPSTIQALLAWVRAGGTLYASDWAISYVSAMLPQDIIEIEEAPDQLVNSTITDTDLQQFTGQTTAQIQYDLPGWYGLRQISNRPRVLLRGSYATYTGQVQNRPLAIVIEEGQGRIIYTSFHNEAGVTSDQLQVLRYYVYLQ
jgi:hypothetical protein